MLASTRALLEKKKKKKQKKKKKKKKKHEANSPQQNITVGFCRIKKYCSYQKLWRFFCDLPAPIDRKSGVRDNLGAGKHPSPLEKKKKKKKKKKGGKNKWSSSIPNSTFLPHQKILLLSKVMAV